MSLILKGGALATIAGSGAAGWRIYATGMLDGASEAFEPWYAFGSMAPGDPKRLVAAAILASNPHNTQPWSFALSNKQIDVFAVPERNLGSFDPYRREMWIGLGCAIENIVQACWSSGFAVSRIDYRPDAATDTHAARITLTPAPIEANRLGDAIPLRRTNRASYDPERAVPPAFLEKLEGLVTAEHTRLIILRARDPAGQRFASQTIEATRWINADATMTKDSHHWFRANPREVLEHRDGVSVPTAGLDPLITSIGQILPEPDAQKSGEYWLNSTTKQVENTPNFAFIAVRDLYDRVQQLEAGRLWQRLHLELTASGLAGHPMNQLPEVVDRERQLGLWARMATSLTTMTGDAAWLPTFAFRLGFPTQEVPHSVRRPFTAVVSRAV